MQLYLEEFFSQLVVFIFIFKIFYTLTLTPQENCGLMRISAQELI